MYFMVKSCIHTVRWPELHQNMPYLSPYHRPILNSAKFRENIEIPRLGSKFHVPRKTVVPSMQYRQAYDTQVLHSVFCLI